MAGRCLSCRSSPVGADAEARLGRVAVGAPPTSSRSRAARAAPRRASTARRRRARTSLAAPRRARARPPTMLTPRRASDDALDHAVAELLLVVVPLPVAVVDAAHGRVAPVDDADPAPESTYDRAPRARRAGARRGTPAALACDVLFEAQVAEVRARPVDRAADASPALRPQRAEVVHLLEERRQVLRLGHGDVVAQLEQARVVAAPFPRAADTSAPRACSSARCTVASSRSSSRTTRGPLGVVFEARERRASACG